MTFTLQIRFYVIYKFIHLLVATIQFLLTLSLLPQPYIIGRLRRLFCSISYISTIYDISSLHVQAISFQLSDLVGQDLYCQQNNVARLVSLHWHTLFLADATQVYMLLGAVFYITGRLLPVKQFLIVLLFLDALILLL